MDQINPVGSLATFFVGLAFERKVKGNLFMTQCRCSLVCFAVFKSEENNFFLLIIY